MIPVKARKTARISTVTRVSTEAQIKTQRENWTIFCLKGMISTVSILALSSFAKTRICYVLKAAIEEIKDEQEWRAWKAKENKKGRVPK